MDRSQLYLLLFLISCIFCSSGCMRVGPDYSPLIAPVEQEWLGMETKQSADDSDWWQEFSDPDLSRIIALAVEQNLSLQVAAIRIAAAKAELQIAIGLLYPQQQAAVGSWMHTRLSKNAPPISTLPPDFQSLTAITNDVYTLEGQVAWELDFWGKYSRGIDAATAHLCGEVFAQHALVVSLVAEVAEVYLSIREAQELLSVVDSNIEVQRRSVEIAENRFAHGVVTELDVQQARTLLASTQAEGTAVEKFLLHSGNALATLLGVPPDSLPLDLCNRKPLPTVPLCLDIGVPCDLLRRRPDLRELEMRAYAQSQRIGMATADLLPHFSLFGTLGFRSENLGRLLDGNSTAVVLGPGFHWDILHYGRLQNVVRIEDAGLQVLIEEYKHAALRAQQEVEDAMATFCRTWDQQQFLLQGVESARRAVDLAQLQYGEGLVDFTAVLLAEDYQLQLERRYVRAVAQNAKGLVQVYRSLGGGWQVLNRDYLDPEVQQQMECRTNWGSIFDHAVVGCEWDGEECTGDEK